MEQKLKKILLYFSFFDYYPNFEEIYTFFPAKIGKKKLVRLLKTQKYTPPQYGVSDNKYQISQRKLNSWRFKIYVKLLSLSPQIKLVGLSGSIAMMNAGLDDDIDLFIITAKNRLFTGRFLATIFAIIIGLKRGKEQLKAPNKVCLNLFFDESKLAVPSFKRTEFVGHEILQMKPLISKDKIYDKFLQANRWVLNMFPNAASVSSMKYEVSSKKILNTKYFILNTFFNKIESALKYLQLQLINRHRTTEIVTDSQLWFHPVDFGEKVKAIF